MAMSARGLEHNERAGRAQAGEPGGRAWPVIAMRAAENPAVAKDLLKQRHYVIVSDGPQSRNSRSFSSDGRERYWRDWIRRKRSW